MTQQYSGSKTVESPAVGSGRSLPLTSGSREARLNKKHITWDRIYIFTEVDGAMVKWWSKFNF